jgi:hypothetical protein
VNLGCRNASENGQTTDSTCLKCFRSHRP